ncbi:Zn-ribbon-containing protein [[Mannheimia] succiniciproducens]|uniref:Zn-ribbon-containing protein n=1 Tax=Mannheimia succiniciproducens (strain KCTC 0769BP / MBEL55E) TaxID=221988 RepID=Q65TN3_MANSM|nr:Zn-ribbon-containing protein [[Mannheimia] succiniciproducens]AAU37677.1 unknown [[Mannheimia] succiniciproducens MBEL55E]
MYLVEVFFKNINEDNLPQQIPLINQLIDQWRYNGQIIGREIPVFVANQENERGLATRVICPEQQSLLPEYNNAEVNRCLANIENCGLILHSFQIVGEDLNSDITYEDKKPDWQILYTTYLQVCSPLHSGDRLAPIPLYKQLKDVPHLSMDVIKWQENWQACDQLQMNAVALESQALREISDINSRIFKHGYSLTKEIEEHTGVPTYYYLYRVGGKNLASESARHCPICHGDWKLAQPLFDQFHFKCDHCRLVSNISWNFL